MAPLVHPVYTELHNLHLEALSIEDKDINMARLNHPAYNEVPNLILAASSVEGKDIEATTYRIAPPLIELPNELPNLLLAASSVEGTDIEAPAYRMALLYPKTPRLVTYKSKTDNCVSCSKIPEQYCTSCCWTEIYCNADGQNDHWPILIKKEYQVLKIQFLIEIIVATVKKESTEDTEATSDLITLLNPKYPRLVTYENKLEDCFSCSKTSKQFCNDCCVMVYYFNADCQKDHWPLLKDMFQVLEIQFLTEIIEASVKHFTKGLGEFIPDINCALINIPDLCNWKNADKEYIPSDSESDEFETEVWEKDLLYVDFVGSLFDTKNTVESESEDQEYEPSESDSDNCGLSDESDVSNHEEDYLIVESKVDCLIAECKQLEYPEFAKRVFESDSMTGLLSEDQIYDLSESDSDNCWSSDDTNISDNEVDQLLVEWQQYMKQDNFFYKYFKSKLVAVNPSKMYVLNDSDDGAVAPSTKSMDFQDESKIKSQDKSFDEGSQVSENEIGDFTAEYKQFLYKDFVDRFGNKLSIGSDSEDQDYEPSESNSDDCGFSDESDCSPECNRVEFVKVSAAEEYHPVSEAFNTEPRETALHSIDFVGDISDNRNIMQAESEYQEYKPTESDSNDCESSNVSNISNNEEDYLNVECKVDSLITKCKQLAYAEFVKRVFDNKPAMESDSEDHEYELSGSDSDGCWSSDESNISDHEVDHLIAELKHDEESLSSLNAQFLYEDFVRLIDNELIDSDSDDEEYSPSDSDSEISDDSGSSDESYILDNKVNCFS